MLTSRRAFHFETTAEGRETVNGWVCVKEFYNFLLNLSSTII